MGRIPEFRRRQLASSAVGTPGVDNSRADIFGSLSKVAGKVKQVTQERQARLDVVEVNQQVIDYELQLDELGRQARKKFSRSPEKGEELFTNQSQQLLEARLGKIKSSGARQSFSNIAKQIQGRKQIQYQKARHRQEDLNAIASINDSVTNLGQQARLKGLNGDIEGLGEVNRMLDGVFIAGDFVLSETEREGLRKDASRNVTTNFIFGMMEKKPEQLNKVLEDERLSKMFTAEELAGFRTQNDRSIRRKQIVQLEAKRARHDVNQRDLLESFYEGNLNLTTVHQAITSDQISQKGGRYLENLLLSDKTVTPKTNPVEYLEVTEQLYGGI